MSDQVQVKITGMVITQRYGSLNAGYILRTDAKFAKHLVEDCGAAEYVASPVANEDAVLKVGDAVVVPATKVKGAAVAVERQSVVANPKTKSKSK